MSNLQFFFLHSKNVLNSLCFGKHIAKIHPNKIGKNYVSKLNGQGSIAANSSNTFFRELSLKKLVFNIQLALAPL